MTSQPVDSRRLPQILLALATLCLLLSNPASAQAQDDAAKQQRTVIKQMMYTDVREVAPILKMLDVKFELMPEQSAIVLRASNVGDLETALKLLDNLDAPTPDLELTVFILSGSKEKTAGSHLPEDLRPITDKLGQLFSYRSFELLDTILLRAKNGRAAEVMGGLRQGSGGSNDYSLRFRRARIVPQELSSDPEAAKRGNTLRFDGLTFNLGSDEGTARARLQTDIEVHEGQKAVLGKATPAGAPSDALILVVEARVIRQE